MISHTAFLRCGRVRIFGAESFIARCVLIHSRMIDVMLAPVDAQRTLNASTMSASIVNFICVICFATAHTFNILSR
jgi:hypothetical protein